MPEKPHPPDMPSPRWSDALLAARVLAVAGASIGGIRVRAGAGPVRDTWLAIVRSQVTAEAPWLRIPSAVAPEKLTGGIDIAATLQTGTPVSEKGLLACADGGFAVLAMAERTERSVAGIITQAMDGGVCSSREGIVHAARFALVALDEGEDGDEALPAPLADRLAITIDLNPISIGEAAGVPEQVGLPGSGDVGDVMVPAQIAMALAEVSLHFPSQSVRRLIALNALVKTIAALDGKAVADNHHAATAIRLCAGVRLGDDVDYEDENDGPRPGENEPPAPRNEGESPQGDDQSANIDDAMDMLVAIQAAARAALLKLDASKLGRAGASAKTGKSGAQTSASKRGRPGGLMLQPPYPEARPDIAATLRAAIPWQRLRNRDWGKTGQRGVIPLRVLPCDFRYIRYRHRTESTAIFAVDASGSTALARLAEAKGAVELLLADCYVRRDNVALIAFRGTDAETLLEPTRSLVRAKRSLAGLPGGGPTPLAKGIMRSLELANIVSRRGQSPLIVYLTDGNGNIALDGKADRARAQNEADSLARKGAALSYRSILIDIGSRPRDTARALADAMQAEYCPLPHATAAAVSTIVGRHLRTG